MSDFGFWVVLNIEINAIKRSGAVQCSNYFYAREIHGYISLAPIPPQCTVYIIKGIQNIYLEVIYNT